MKSYHFITNWELEASCAEVYKILKASDDLPRWWPSVYLEVKTIEKGGENGLGKTIELYTKGWLPYTLRWKSRVTEVHPENHSGFSLEALRDFVGRGIWTFTKEGTICNMFYDG